MKHAKWIVLVVSIIFIVSGLAFIVSGIQNKTVTVPLSVKADKISSESNKTKTGSTNKSSAKKAQKKSEVGSSTVHSKLSSRSDADSAGNSSARSNSESDSKTAAHSTSKPQQSAKSSGSSTVQSRASNAATSSNQELVSVEISGYDNKNFSGHVPFKNGMTAFRALKTLTDSKNIALDYSGFGPAIYVKSINGQSAGDKSAQSGWIYTVNGKTPNVSAGSYTLHSGDTLVWIYQE